MLPSPSAAALSNTPTAVPSDRPPEASSFLGSTSSQSVPTAPTSLGFPGATQTPSLFQTRSYVGALRGPGSTPAGGNQNWIPVGSHDITSSVSNGIKSLSLSKDFKEKLCKPWSSSVVVRLLGRNIGYSFLCHRLHAIWKPVGQLHIVDLDKNCFMVKFANDQDYFKALTGGPWMILDHYLIVHQWDPSFRVADDLPKKMVAWVRFPHLPIHFYHVQVLTSLGNLVGKTIKIDFKTQRAERGKFARIAVELDLDEPLPPVVMLDGATQLIEYENLPNLCFDCGRIGHEAACCPLKLAVVPVATAAPAGDPASESPDPNSLPAPDRYGPWMVVDRRSSRPKRESQAGKARVDPRIRSAVIPERDSAPSKERDDGEMKQKSRAGVKEKSVEGGSSNPSGANKRASSSGPPTTNTGPTASANSRPKISTKKARKGKGQAKLLQGEPVVIQETTGAVASPPPTTEPPSTGKAPGVVDGRADSVQLTPTIGILPQGAANAGLFDNLP
ncbi:hypothetical protein LINPERHAP2_LOCUS33563 [Linum perenne]